MMTMKATAATTMPPIAPLDRLLPPVLCAGVEVADEDGLVVAVAPAFVDVELLLVDVI